MSMVVAGLGVLVALPGVVVALHLGVLAVASWFYREPAPTGRVPQVRFLALVPAHNEERVIGGTLAALAAAARPGDRVLVVADRCTDRTADLARAAGAEVLERGPDQVPGRAAARQDGLDLAVAQDDWDAVLFIDADSVVSPDFLAACERALAATGAPALQARSEAALGRGLIAQSYLAAFALQGLTIPRGRDRLRLSVRLRGTGMVLRRDVLKLARFRAPASEDLFYSLDLCLERVLPRHVESARLRSANVGSWTAASSQRTRYEAGRMAAAREFAGPLLRAHTAASVEALVHVLTPPIAVAAASLLAGLGLTALAGAWPVAAALAVAVGLLAVTVLTGLVQSRAGARTWLALAAAPWYMMFKLAVQARALATLRRPGTEFGATPRD
jgi:hypothetical protein